MKKKNILAENMRRFGTKNLQENVKDNQEFKKTVMYIFKGAVRGEDMTDDIVDELGDFYDEVYSSGDPKLIRLYNQLRSVSDDEPQNQAKQAGSLIQYIGYDTNNTDTPNIPYTEWEIIDTIDGVYHLVAEYKGKYYTGLADKVGHVVGLDADMDIYDVEEIDKAEYDRLS